MRACWNRTLGLFDQHTRYRKPESLGDPQIPLYGEACSATASRRPDSKCRNGNPGKRAGVSVAASGSTATESRFPTCAT